MAVVRTTVPRWVWGALAGALAIYLLFVLRDVLTPVFFAFLLAYMLDPVVDKLEEWRIPRAAAIVLLLGLLLSAMTAFILLVVPSVVRDLSTFASEVPQHVSALWLRVQPVLERNHVHVPRSWQEAVLTMRIDVRQLAERAISPASDVFKTVIGTTASAIATIAGLLVIPVFAFYLLYDFDRMRAAARELIPWRYRTLIVDVFTEIDATLGQFVRGQLTVMAILGSLYASSFSLLGVRLAVPIGVIAGLLTFIPYVGSGTALVLGLLMSVLDYADGGYQRIIGVIAAYTIVQALDGLFITPRILGGKVGLSAIWVLLALMIGGQLFGFLGVLLAVPSAAVAKILIRRAVAHYRTTSLFREGEPEAASPGSEESGDG